MPRTSDLPRVLTPADARHVGLSRSAVRHGIRTFGWTVLGRGLVLTVPDGPTRDDWTMVGMALTGPGAALSGWDAARIRGLGPRVPPNDEVLVLDRSGNHRLVGAVRIRPTSRPYGTSLLPEEHPTLPFVTVVHPARAVADTALLYRTFDPVRAMVTSAIQRGVCRPDDLLAELESAPRQGSRWLRKALADVIAGAKSIAEAEAIEWLARASVPSFEVNVPIVDRFGTLVAEADLLWRELRMIVEVDSREFHFSEQDWKRTQRRHTFLTRHGFAVEHPSSSFHDQQAVVAARATTIAC
jgi:hypothetical protein